MRKILLILILIGSLFFLYTLLEPYWLKVEEITIRDPDIPASFNNFKIAFLTDIHHSPSFSRDRVEKVVEKVNALKPDVILLGGDYAEEELTYLRDCLQVLGKLEAPHGIYGVLGNHEFMLDPDVAWGEMEANKIASLDNKGIWLYRNEGRIRLGGVGDLWNDSQRIEKVVENVERDDFVILLSHNPDYIERMTTDKVDLILSGHTHGGQVTIFGLWAPVHPSSYGQKYISGLVETPRAKLLVSNGIGFLDKRPLRFFARPQINVIYLRNSEQI